MFSRYFGIAIILGASLALGCGAKDSSDDEQSSSLVAFQYKTLANITPRDVMASYSGTLTSEVAQAETENPDVEHVSPAGVEAFADYHDTLKGSLNWYFQKTSVAHIDVGDIVGKLVAAVEPVIDAAVGPDGTFLRDRLGTQLPDEIVWSIGDAREDVALRAAVSPPGMDLAKLFSDAKMQWGYDALYLPGMVTAEPTPDQLSTALGLQMGPPLVDDAARAQIAQYFELEAGVLTDILPGAPAIRRTWYFHEHVRDYDTHVALFLDQNDQLWGFRLTFMSNCVNNPARANCTSSPGAAG